MSNQLPISHMGEEEGACRSCTSWHDVVLVPREASHRLSSLHLDAKTEEDAVAQLEKTLKHMTPFKERKGARGEN